MEPNHIAAVFGILLMFLISVNNAVLRQDYLTLTCHVVVSTLSGGRVESSSGLTYEDNMNCSFRVRVPDNKRIMLRFIRFELEKKRSGVCVDYLNIHDGDDLGASTLNTEPLCGEHKTLGNFTTSAGSVVLHFVTDQTAVYRGFDVLYHAFSSAPCSKEEFTCSSNTCIDSSLICDDVNHCGDNSDETQALCSVTRFSQGGLHIGGIIGISVGGAVLLIILIVAIYKFVDHIRWQKWLRENNVDTDPWDALEDEKLQNTIENLYPVNRYQTRPASVLGKGRHTAVVSPEGVRKARGTEMKKPAPSTTSFNRNSSAISGLVPVRKITSDSSGLI